MPEKEANEERFILTSKELGQIVHDYLYRSGRLKMASVTGRAEYYEDRAEFFFKPLPDSSPSRGGRK